MKKKKILAILSIIVLLLTNYSFVVEAAVAMSYPLTGGSALSGLNPTEFDANSSEKVYYLDGDYNANSIKVGYNNIEVCEHNNLDKKLVLGGVYGKNAQGENAQSDRYNIPNYEKGKYYLFGNPASIDNAHDDLCYAIKLPADSEMDESGIATFIFKNAISYNGKTYNVRLDINRIKKTGNAAAIFEVRVGSRAKSDSDITVINSYNEGVLPNVAVQRGETTDENRKFNVEADIDYSIIDPATKAEKKIRGVWGINDIDKNGGIVIKDYQLIKDDVFVEKSIKQAQANRDNEMLVPINYIMYSNGVDNGTGAFLYSSTEKDTALGDVYMRIEDKSKISTVKVWNDVNDASSYEMIDGIIGRYHNIVVEVVGGTYTPSGNLVKIKDNENRTISYQPTDASKQYLKSIEVDGNEITIDNNNSSSYTFSDIKADHKIKIVYENKYKVEFDTKGGVAKDPTKIETQYKLSGEKAIEPNTTITKPGYTFAGWYLDLNGPKYVFDTPVTKDIKLLAKWTPVQYKINYILNGGTNNSANVDAGKDYKTYTVEDDLFLFKEPTKANNTFVGWKDVTEGSQNYGKTITGIPARSTGDKTVEAVWSENDLTYDIQHFIEENGKYPDNPNQTTHGSGKVGTTQTATPLKSILDLGYEQDTSKSAEATGKIPASGKLVLKLYYKEIVWNINYETNGGTNPTSNPKTYKKGEVKPIANATRDGYVFQGWYTDPKCEDESTKVTSTQGKSGDFTVYAKWAKSTKTPYTVEHFLKNSEGKYELKDRKELEGTTGEEVVATPLKDSDIPGYKLNESLGKLKGNIEADGSLKLQLYYDPIEYKIEYTENGGVNDPTNPKSYTINDRKEIKPATREGYEFKGWYEDENFKGNPIVLIENRTGNIHLYAKWEAKNVGYKVEHYLEDKNGEYKLETTKSYPGKTDEKVTATALELPGYEEKTTENTIKSGTVKADGSLVLKLYYSRIKYTVSFDPQNGGTIPDQKVPYLDTAKEPANPTKEGNKFEYWYYINEDGKQVQYDFDTPVTSDIKLIAKWTLVEDKTKAPDKIPQTGEFNPIMAFSMIALVTLAGAFGIKYFKLNKIMK